jgi:hypothetical protein
MSASPDLAQQDDHPRLAREKKTIAAMLRIYCGRHHDDAQVCNQCGELLQYALARLDRCPFGAEKSTCARCPVHCYKPAMRERIRQVMRYAGPRILLRHPILAIRHWLDGRKPVPAIGPRPGPHPVTPESNRHD